MRETSGVYGIRPPDEKWRQMKAVYDACIVASVEIPEEVIEFFDGEAPIAEGVLLDLTFPKLHESVT